MADAEARLEAISTVYGSPFERMLNRSRDVYRRTRIRYWWEWEEYGEASAAASSGRKFMFVCGIRDAQERFKAPPLELKLPPDTLHGSPLPQ
jgi:hypothetical protein